MFSFLHLSDIHMPTLETETRHSVSPYQRLEHLINSIDKLEYPPSFAIITGDLSRDGTIEGYKLIKRHTERLNEMGIRTMLAMGNHDDRDNYRRVFRTPSPSGPIYYSEDQEPLRIVVLDSLHPGSHGGRFDDEQLNWLSEKLKSDHERPTIIAFHHPIYMSPQKVTDGKLFDRSQRDEFYRVASRSNVLAIIHGHLHNNQIGTVNGVLHVQAGSTMTELNFDEEEYWIVNTSSYNQVIFRVDMLFVKTKTLPYDGRVLARRPIEDLFE
jgi:Icc protein